MNKILSSLPFGGGVLKSQCVDEVNEAVVYMACRPDMYNSHHLYHVFLLHGRAEGLRPLVTQIEGFIGEKAGSELGFYPVISIEEGGSVGDSFQSYLIMCRNTPDTLARVYEVRQCLAEGVREFMCLPSRTEKAVWTYPETRQRAFYLLYNQTKRNTTRFRSLRPEDYGYTPELATKLLNAAADIANELRCNYCHVTDYIVYDRMPDLRTSRLCDVILQAQRAGDPEAIGAARLVPMDNSSAFLCVFFYLDQENPNAADIIDSIYELESCRHIRDDFHQFIGGAPGVARPYKSTGARNVGDYANTMRRRFTNVLRQRKLRLLLAC